MLLRLDVIKSKQKERLIGHKRQFLLSLPQGQNQPRGRDQDAATVSIKIAPGQFNVYLNQKTAATILSLEQRNYSLTIPVQVVLQLIYQGYLQGGLQDGITFCGYYVEADQTALFTRTFISLDGDVINQIKRSFVKKQNCLDILVAYHWLYLQLLRQIQNFLNAVASSLAGFVSLLLLTFQSGSRWLQDLDSFPLILAWFWLSGLTVLGFWLVTEKIRSRLFQFFHNRLPRCSFPSFLNTLPWQIASASSSLGLIILIFQENSSLVWSFLLLPCLYHILRTGILPILNRWLLSRVFSSQRLQRVISTFLYTNNAG